jgi:isovaleryl-CoA dehydrogenase
MRTTAALTEDKEHYILNGTKMWISNGTINGKDTADMYLVYAKTSSGRGMADITTFIVEKGMPGFRLGQKILDKCGMRASNTAELVFDNVKVSVAEFLSRRASYALQVPATNVVGQVGGGALCMMRNLQIERVALAGMSLGIARRRY